MTMFVEADAGRLEAKINLLLMNAEQMENQEQSLRPLV